MATVRADRLITGFDHFYVAEHLISTLKKITRRDKIEQFTVANAGRMTISSRPRILF